MSAEGAFHDAHEVYGLESHGGRKWIATFSTRALALDYVARVQDSGVSDLDYQFLEVVPV